MKKKHKIIFIVTSIVLVLAVIVTACALFVSSPNAELKSALADKYNWRTGDIEIVRHTSKRTEHNYDFEGGPRVHYYNEKWVCEYKGREFNVEYTDNQYADDYQLEDIFKWCTEYLQENVDPEIVGVEIFSDIIYHSSEDVNLYNYNLPWDTNKVFTKNDAVELLRIQSEHGLGVFYRKDNLNSYGDRIAMNPYMIDGNNKYIDFCNEKKQLLGKNKVTEDCNIYLINEVLFKRRTGGLSGFTYLTAYSIGEIDYVDSFIKR